MRSATLVLIMVSLLATSAFPAAFTVNLVGKWEGKMSGVKYDPLATPAMAYYKDVATTIRILSQEGDRFYGEVTIAGNTGKFVGLIAGGRGIISGRGMMVVTMPVYEAGFWRMTGHGHGSSPDGYLDAGKFTVHRTSTTP